MNRPGPPGTREGGLVEQRRNFSCALSYLEDYKEVSDIDQLDFILTFIPAFIIHIFDFIRIPESWGHKTPVVEYPRFIAPIVIISPLIWVEIRAQNDSTCFMRVLVSDKAMADMNGRRISATSYDQ